MKRYWLAIGACMLLSPLGLVAEGTAWGEWDAASLADKLGYMPQGMAHLQSFWQALLPDYSMSFLGDSLWAQAIGYIASALLGAALVYLLTLGLTKWLLHGKQKPGYLK